MLPAQQVALVFSLEPAFAAWLSWYFLGEQMSAQGWIGSALILSAVVIGGLTPQEPMPDGVMRQSSFVNRGS